jgi:hypothetical protein
MARRKLTLQEQLKGLRAAVRSKRTPPQLREGLRKRAKWLIEQIRLVRPRKRNKKSFSKRRVRTNQ